jgi:chemotaxis protein MotB
MNQKKSERPIVIVKRVKRGDEHPHGGAWKVAYADFVTSMMAFFLVMWLIASVDKDQRAAIFNYFKNPSMEQGKSVRPAPGQLGPGGASTSVIQLGGALDMRRSSTSLSTGLGVPRPLIAPRDQSALNRSEGATVGQQRGAGMTSLDEARRITEEADHRKLESLLVELRQAIDQSQALKPFKDQLLLDITPEGLRIQIVDAQNRPMFDLGSAKLKSYTADILRTLAPYLNTVPNHLSLSGHTDTTPYVAQAGYNNWDLSTDRANAARRALEAGGLGADKIARVVGLSSVVLFDRANPRDAVNRRISIIVMTKEAEEAALNTDTPGVATAQGSGSAASAADSAPQSSRASQQATGTAPQVTATPPSQGPAALPPAPHPQ